MKKIILLLTLSIFYATFAQADSTLGGYGEMHYNNIENKNSDDKITGTKKAIDFHRFVLFLGHDFDDNVRMFSELELEHSLSGEGKPGEVELEQSYIEMDLGEQTQLKTGLMLIPVGILNETHEPPTFYGVERNPIEKEIIPATWWEGGIGISGQFGEGFSYDVLLHSGLNNKATTSVTIRKARQKVAKAVANSLATTARIKYTGIRGLELAATAQYQDDLSQQTNDDISNATLIEAHAAYNTGGLTLKALHAMWAANVNEDVAGLKATKDQTGSYVEAGYKFTNKIGVFARHNVWSTKDKVDNNQNDIGVNYWPHERVVMKLDLMQKNTDSSGTKTKSEGFNLGVGYQF